MPIRLTGQDTERGTFSQRHLVLHDASTGQAWTPMQQLPGALAPMELHNSPLSELATLGFEYGYSAAAPEVLVLWEAQFGDFINGAQVIVDQFLSAGLSKWGLTTRLTLLLPHGYEGQGPEHSSARLERFLQLAAEGNIRVANPHDAGAVLPPAAPPGPAHPPAAADHHDAEEPAAAAPGQLQAGGAGRRRVASGARRPGHGRAAPARSPRLVLCSGKIYYDLLAEADKMRGEAAGHRPAGTALFVPLDRDARGAGALRQA